MLSHGYPVQEGDDPLIKIADTALDGFAKSSTPGAWMVDIFPISEFTKLDLLYKVVVAHRYPFVPFSEIYSILDARRRMEETSRNMEE